ncbi:sulfate permease [Diplocarpon rosae]|nr:sulfate permease [Diplocarpon rosae]
MGAGGNFKSKMGSDPNFPRLGRGIVMGIRGVRAGAGKYFSDKLPVVQWISTYSPKWLVDDALAGVSVGLLMLPQALTYSGIAGVPIQHALLASWLPGLIYSVMGTSRGVVTFALGIWSLIFGIFKLGFIFDFITIPMSLGFTLGTAIVVVQLQLPTILGIEGLSYKFTEMMPQLVHEIGKTRPITFAIAAASLFLVIAMTVAGYKWGKKNVFVRVFCATRTIHTIVMFTGVSYFVNNGLEFPKWSVLGPVKTAIPAAAPPLSQLLSSLFLPMIMLMLSTALEHVALAKAYGNKFGYKVDASQEIFSLGVVNVISSFFGAMPAGGGDIARASVNITSGVKSPLSGIFTSITVLVSMYAMSSTLTYMPLATAAAVVMVVVTDQQPSTSLMGKFWKLSFVDFIQFLLAFNVTIMHGGSFGIGLSIFFMVVYTLMRLMFSRPAAIVSVDLENQYSRDTPPWWGKEDRIPAGTQVIKFETDAIWLNAERLKRHILDTVYTYQSGIPNVVAVRTALREYAGEDLQLRFVGVNQQVQRRFERGGWQLVSPHDEPIIERAVTVEELKESDAKPGEVIKVSVFEHLPHAIQYISPAEPHGYHFDGGKDVEKY